MAIILSKKVTDIGKKDSLPLDFHVQGQFVADKETVQERIREIVAKIVELKGPEIIGNTVVFKSMVSQAYFENKITGQTSIDGKMLRSMIPELMITHPVPIVDGV